MRDPIVLALSLLMAFTTSAQAKLIETAGKIAFTDAESALVDAANIGFATELNALEYKILIQKIMPRANGPGTSFKNNTIKIELTRDIEDPYEFAAVFCHELGHVISYSALITEKGREFREYVAGYTDVEGECDYFAASKCLPRLMRVLPKVATPAICMNASDVERCSFVAQSGMKAVEGMNRRNPDLNVAQILFGTPTRYVDPTSTSAGNPEYACRLQTFVAGGMCEASPWSGFDVKNEESSACVHGSGKRPNCWYQPGTHVGVK